MDWWWIAVREMRSQREPWPTRRKELNDDERKEHRQKKKLFERKRGKKKKTFDFPFPDQIGRRTERLGSRNWIWIDLNDTFVIVFVNIFFDIVNFEFGRNEVAHRHHSSNRFRPSSIIEVASGASGNWMIITKSYRRPAPTEGQEWDEMRRRRWKTTRRRKKKKSQPEAWSRPVRRDLRQPINALSFIRRCCWRFYVLNKDNEQRNKSTWRTMSRRPKQGATKNQLALWFVRPGRSLRVSMWVRLHGVMMIYNSFLHSVWGFQTCKLLKYRKNTTR